MHARQSAKNNRGAEPAVAVAAFLAFTFIGLHAAAADSGQLLSERPQRAAATSQFEARPSTIAPQVDVPYGVLADAANAAADRFAGPRSGVTPVACERASLGESLPIKVTITGGCASFDWHIDASRNGGITVKQEGPGIAVDVPVKFTGEGSFAGDLGKAIPTGNRNFSGSFVVSISGVVNVNKSFCPQIDRPASHFAWTSAPDIDVIGHTCLEIAHRQICIGPWKFPAGNLLTDQINKTLAKQVDDINQKIPCDQIRNQLKQVWKTWSFPVAITNPPVYVTLQPKSLSIPAVTTTDTGVRIEARLDADAGVATNPAPQTDPGELPQNTPMSTPAGRFSVALPLPIPYPLLSAAGAWRMLNKPLKSGGAGITPVGIEFFPDNDKLAVGVTIRADAPVKVRDKLATVWFTATPNVDDNGHAIRLTNLTLTKKLNNPLWGPLSGAVGQLPAMIASSYSYDFSGLLGDAHNRLNQAIADPKNTGNVKITVANDDLRLGRTALLPGNFVIEGLFNADLTAKPQAPPGQKTANP